MKWIDKIKRFFGITRPIKLECDQESVNIRDFNRGELIKFRIYTGGKEIGGWNAIWHGDGKCHTVGKMKHDTWLMGRLYPDDRITKIRHGVLIERFVP